MELNCHISANSWKELVSKLICPAIEKVQLLSQQGILNNFNCKKMLFYWDYLGKTKKNYNLYSQESYQFLHNVQYLLSSEL